MDNATLNRLDATGRSRRQVGLNYALSCARTTKQMYIRDHPDVEHAYIDEAMRVLEHLITEEKRLVEMGRGREYTRPLPTMHTAYAVTPTPYTHRRNEHGQTIYRQELRARTHQLGV